MELGLEVADLSLQNSDPLESGFQVSPGASKPATRGRFKTSHNSYEFRTRSLILTGSTRCSKCQRLSGKKTLENKEDRSAASLLSDGFGSFSKSPPDPIDAFA